MPGFSIWALRAALIYLLLGFTVGALLLVNKATALDGRLWALLPLHIEFLLFGWLLQLVFGIAYWIFPRFRIAPKRGPELPARAALGLLNGGILLVAVASWLGQPIGVLIGRAGELGAVLVFAWGLWGRVKPTETGRRV